MSPAENVYPIIMAKTLTVSVNRQPVAVQYEQLRKRTAQRQIQRLTFAGRILSEIFAIMFVDKRLKWKVRQHVHGGPNVSGAGNTPVLRRIMHILLHIRSVISLAPAVTASSLFDIAISK
jgi:hypothetical protein